MLWLGRMFRLHSLRIISHSLSTSTASRWQHLTLCCVTVWLLVPLRSQPRRSSAFSTADAAECCDNFRLDADDDLMLDD